MTTHPDPLLALSPGPIEEAPFYWRHCKQDAADGYCNGWNDCIKAMEAARPATELPELPEPCAEVFAADAEGYDWLTPGKCYYTPDQLRAYGQQCASSRPANAREGGDMSDAIEAALYRVQEYMHTHHDFLVPIDEYIDGSQQPTTEEICQGDVTLTTTPEPNNGRTHV